MKLKNALYEAGTIDKYKKNFSNYKKNLQAAEKMSSKSLTQIEEMMEKMEQGSIDIEFMQSPKTGAITLVVKFNGIGVNYFFNKDNKKIKYFSSTASLKNYMDNSLLNVCKSDVKAVYREIFSPESMMNVFKSINDLIQEFPNKSKSLTFDTNHIQKGESNSDWDAQVIFKKSMEEFTKSGEHRIIPKVNGKGRYANVTSPEEIEKNMSKRSLKKLLSNL